MSELEELYQEIVMEHNRQPRNFREPAGANRSANGFNPFCGDMVTLFLKVDDDTIADVGFQGFRLRDIEGVRLNADRERQGQEHAGGRPGYSKLSTGCSPTARTTWTRRSWETWRCCQASPNFPRGSSARPSRGMPCAPALEGSEETVKTE